MSAMRPGLPDPLIGLLGARWAMGAPVVGAAWFGAGDAVAFGLADGTVAIARAAWDGAATLQPRDGGGVELVPATAPAPPVMRVGVHAGPCLDIASDGAGAVLSGGVDGQFTRTRADGSVEVLASFPGSRIERVAAGPAGVSACAVGSQAHRFGAAPATLDLDGPVTALAFDPTGANLAVACPGGVTIWSSGCSADPASTRRLIPPGAPRTLAWSANSQTLVCGLEQAAAHGWRLPDGVGAALGGYPAPPSSLSFSPAGGFFATSGGSRVVCWRLDEPGEAVRTECGVGSAVPVAHVACHPLRPVIAAGYGNGAVLLCQPDSADILFIRAAGGGAVTTLAWSPDGAFLALGAAGGEVGVVAFPGLLFRPDPPTGSMQREASR